MDAVRIQFISSGFREVLLSQGCQEVVSSAADDIAARANANGNTDGFAALTIVGGYGGGRYVGFVSSTTPEAAQAESEDKALTRAIQ